MSNKTTVTAEPNTPFLKIERAFNAPREQVFAAYTQKEKLENWWGPWGGTKIEIDPREGGLWKFSEGKEGEGTTFYGVFHEVTAPERIVQTEEFANIGERGHVVLDRYEFEAITEGQTRVTLTSVFLSVEDRDAAVQSGMQEGVEQQHLNLDSVLAKAGK